LAVYKEWVRSQPLITIAAPLVAMVLLENKISRHYNFGMFNRILSHSLTAALGYYYYVRVVQKPETGIVQTKHTIALEQEYI